MKTTTRVPQPANPLKPNDSFRLASATGRFGITIPVYDDGFGPLFIHRDSMGISGIVRAQTWETAYSICEDEFFPPCELTLAEVVREYGHTREHVKIVRIGGVERPATSEDYPLPEGAFVRWDTVETPDPEAWPENELFCEAFGFRPNGPREQDEPMPGVYSKDLNGDSLDLLTAELLRELEITLNYELY